MSGHVELGRVVGAFGIRGWVRLRSYTDPPEGILRYKVVHDLNIGRSAEETLRVIQALQTGGLCQAEWKPGQKTLNA